MQPDPKTLLAILEIETPPIGFYDAPATAPFEPIAGPEGCIFAHYPRWLAGEQGWALTELHEAPFSLEDTFISLTRSGGGQDRGVA